MVRLAGFEPAAYGLEVRCSIQLSYRRTNKMVFYQIFCALSTKNSTSPIFFTMKYCF